MAPAEAEKKPAERGGGWRKKEGWGEGEDLEPKKGGRRGLGRRKKAKKKKTRGERREGGGEGRKIKKNN